MKGTQISETYFFQVQILFSFFILLILLMYLIIQNILFCIKKFCIRHLRFIWTYYYIFKIYLAYYALDQYRRLPQRMILLSRMEEYLPCKRTTTLLSICCHFSYLSNLHLYWVSKIYKLHIKVIYGQIKLSFLAVR